MGAVKSDNGKKDSCAKFSEPVEPRVFDFGNQSMPTEFGNQA